jgi:RHS repeat-associated protein
LRREEFTAFGASKARSQAASVGPTGGWEERFHGIRADELMVAGGRAYDSERGSWLSRDPLAMGSPAAVLNDVRLGARYGFNNGNPYQYRDPTGRGSWNSETKDYNLQKDKAAHPEKYPVDTTPIGNVPFRPIAVGTVFAVVGWICPECIVAKTGADVASADSNADRAIIAGSFLLGSYLGKSGSGAASAEAAVVKSEREVVSLYRGVGQAELTSIKQTGRITPSPNGAESKYFAADAQSVSSYARQLGTTDAAEALTIASGEHADAFYWPIHWNEEENSGLVFIEFLSPDLWKEESQIGATFSVTTGPAVLGKGEIYMIARN